MDYMCLTCDFSISKDEVDKIKLKAINSNDPVNEFARLAKMDRACCKLIVLNSEIYTSLEEDYMKRALLKNGVKKEFETLNFKE